MTDLTGAERVIAGWSRMSRGEQIVAELDLLADDLDRKERAVHQLRERRLQLWIEGQAIVPRLTQKALADPSRVTEGAVTQALRKVSALS